jgi:hypothetical protein
MLQTIQTDSDTRDALIEKVSALYETKPENPLPGVDFLVRGGHGIHFQDIRFYSLTIWL